MKLFRRNYYAADWHNFRRLHPISRLFGFDRGLPIDRFYIEHFLQKYQLEIKGVACEVAGDEYIKKFGTSVNRIEIMHIDPEWTKATFIGDLTKINTLPSNQINCLVLTQTLNFIYDVDLAVKGIHNMLVSGGCVLATVSGLSNISRYDMDRWGDYWRFTDLSIRKIFEKYFQPEDIKVSIYGNVLSAVAGLQGLSAEELTTEELLFEDHDYQVTIGVYAKKK